jgi:hypothetical protein
MSPDFAAAVCEGICGTLEELLSRELPEEARKILLDLQAHAGTAADLLCADGPNAELAQQRVCGPGTGVSRGDRSDGEGAFPS